MGLGVLANPYQACSGIAFRIAVQKHQNVTFHLCQFIFVANGTHQRFIAAGDGLVPISKIYRDSPFRMFYLER